MNVECILASFIFLRMYIRAQFPLSQLNTAHLQVNFYIKRARARDLIAFPLEFKKVSFFFLSLGDYRWIR